MLKRLILAVPVIILTSQTSFADEPFRRSVTVSGEGKVETVPDRALLPVTVETKDKSLSAAKQANDRRMDALLKVTASFSIPNDKVKTSGVYIAPQYRWEEKTNKQIFETYVVSRSITITIDPLDQAEKLLAKLTESGIDQIQGIQFTLSNPEALEANARKLAVQDARGKAQALAEAAGAKLGKVLTITTGGGGYTPRPMMARAMDMKAEAASAPPPVLPGMTEINENVTIVYELE